MADVPTMWLAGFMVATSHGLVELPRYDLMHRYTVRNAVERGAVCNDGTPAKYYYRNCTALGDRAPGDKTDYCKKGDPNGVQSVQWFIQFDSGDGKWCFDKVGSEAARRLSHSAVAGSCALSSGPPHNHQASCAGRNRSLMSSDGLPPTMFIRGWLSPYPEENPNFCGAARFPALPASGPGALRRPVVALT